MDDLPLARSRLGPVCFKTEKKRPRSWPNYKTFRQRSSHQHTRAVLDQWDVEPDSLVGVTVTCFASVRMGVRSCCFEAVRSSEHKNRLGKRVLREKLTLVVSGSPQQRKQSPHGDNIAACANSAWTLGFGEDKSLFLDGQTLLKVHPN